MTRQNISDAIGNIADRHVKELANFKGKKNNKIWVKWAVSAACLALVIAFAPTLYHILTPSQMTDPWRVGILYEIEDIQALPNNNGEKILAQNLELSPNAQIELYYNEGGSASNIEDWFTLIISDSIQSTTETETMGEHAFPKEEENLLMICLFDGRTVEDQKVDMIFTKDATQKLDINGTEVQIARNELSISYEYWYYAVFEHDGVIYDVRTQSDRPEYIYEVLEGLLGK